LEKLYNGVDNVDMWLGIIGERPEPNSMLGELGIRVNGFQFKTIRNADRYWYENTFPQSIIDEIKRTSLGDVIKRNSNVRILNSSVFKKTI
jgi:hypothetical protein